MSSLQFAVYPTILLRRAVDTALAQRQFAKAAEIQEEIDRRQQAQMAEAR